MLTKANKCPKWADKWAKTREKCDKGCGARLVHVKSYGRNKDGSPAPDHLVCSRTGWLPPNCTKAHPEVVVKVLAGGIKGKSVIRAS
jgi:hypothetical protein